jgi:hypothetical protein
MPRPSRSMNYEVRHCATVCSLLSVSRGLPARDVGYNVAVATSKIPPWNLPGGSKENHEILNHIARLVAAAAPSERQLWSVLPSGIGATQAAK